MFNYEYLFKVFKYLNGENVDLEDQIKNIASSELGKTQELFERTLDQGAFSSEDYRRLRSFLIIWYATHKTLTSIQDNANELFFLPEEHLYELMKSFGFPLGNKIRGFRNKANFFLELVDLYKIKGTPQSVVSTLSYFNIPDTYLVELILKKNKENDIVFGQRVAEYLPGYLKKAVNLQDMNFYTIVNNDPHWMMSKEDIEELIKKNKINLPSKSPYFSLRTTYEYKRVEPVPLYFKKLYQDFYEQWKSGTIPERTIYCKVLKDYVSVFELYTAIVYCTNLYYRRSKDNGPILKLYSGDEEYKEYKKSFDKQFEVPPYNRDLRDQKSEEWLDKFTEKRSDYELSEVNEAGNILSQIHKSIKDLIDTWERQRLFENISSLLTELSYWLTNNIPGIYQDLSVYTFGWSAYQSIDVRGLIDFFKPYRSRFILSDLEYIWDRPLFESIRYKEELYDKIRQLIVEFATADSKPCSEDKGPRTEYDCGSYYDIGIATDSDYAIVDTENKLDDDLYHVYPDRTEEPHIQNFETHSDWVSLENGDYLETESGELVELETIINVYGYEAIASQDTGFPEFDEDENLFYDEGFTHLGNEIFVVYAERINPTFYDTFIISEQFSHYITDYRTDSLINDRINNEELNIQNFSKYSNLVSLESGDILQDEDGNPIELESSLNFYGYEAICTQDSGFPEFDEEELYFDEGFTTKFGNETFTVYVEEV